MNGHNGQAYPAPMRVAAWVDPEARRRAWRRGFIRGLAWGAFGVLLAEVAFILAASHIYHKVVAG